MRPNLNLILSEPSQPTSMNTNSLTIPPLLSPVFPFTTIYLKNHNNPPNFSDKLSDGVDIVGLVDVEVKGSDGNANTPGLGPGQALVSQTTTGMVVNPTTTPKAPSLPTENWDYQATPVTIREVNIFIDYSTLPLVMYIPLIAATFYRTI